MTDFHDDLVPEIEYYVHRICTPEWKIDERTIRYVDMTYLVSGSAVYFVNGNEYSVKAGDLLCIPAGSCRAAVTSADCLMECYCVNFRLTDSSGNPVQLPFPVVSHLGVLPETIAAYNDLSMEWIMKKPGYRIKIRAVFLSILHGFFKAIVYKKNSGIVDHRIKKSMIYISEHYHEPIDLTRIAGLFNLHPVYFGALFKETTGMTFREYLTEVRLNHAEDLLWAGIYSVCTVSLMCGFSDVFYFSKVFKAKRGISPSRIGKQNKYMI